MFLAFCQRADYLLEMFRRLLCALWLDHFVRDRGERHLEKSCLICQFAVFPLLY